MGSCCSSPYDAVLDMPHWVSFDDLYYTYEKKRHGLHYIRGLGVTRELALTALNDVAKTAGIAIVPHKSGKLYCGNVRYVKPTGLCVCSPTYVGYSQVFFRYSKITDMYRCELFYS